jgi:hypothetical protein
VNDLHDEILAIVYKHLPGQHNQLDHGRDNPESIEDIPLYHGGSAKIIDSVMEKGLNPGESWFGRNPSVYASTNPDEAFGYAITQARKTYELGRGKTVKGVVFEVRPPKDELRNFIADQKQSNDSWRIEKTIPKDWITGYKVYSLTIDDKFFAAGRDGINKLWIVESNVKLKQMISSYYVPIIFYSEDSVA